ncbi:transposase [Janthinobacterium sp. CG_23.4]|nr:transposase [Janthinobacterium sp. CG_23.4]
MSKYAEQFKLAVVKQYLAGASGFQFLANQHGVPYSMVRKWVGLFRQHGEDGLRKKFSHYDADFKLSVLQHMWANDLSYGKTAAVFNIRHHAAVGVWERCYHTGGIDALMPRRRGRPTKMPSLPDTKPSLPVNDSERTHEELVAEVNQLRMEVAYLKKLRALVQSQQLPQATARKKRK